jgi:hypothetical protein
MRALIHTTEKNFLLHFLSLLDRKYAAQHPSNPSHSNDLLCPGRDGRYLPPARVRDALCPAEARQPGPHVQHHREPARLRHSWPAPGIKNKKFRVFFVFFSFLFSTALKFSPVEVSHLPSVLQWL